MVGVAPEADDGSRRRLPQWMLGISSSGQVRKPSNGKEEGPTSYETETLGENSRVLVKCETKRRKRKSTKQDMHTIWNHFPPFLVGISWKLK
ncbi:hypothetical protein GBA52_013783, partial [Prunus armeniaca]